jgi:RelA/SpoT family (p)ppGpp synthetase
LGDVTLIREALEFSKRYHRNFKRNSGDPYVLHPIAVAARLADIKSDRETLIAALLHDILEDTDASRDEIKKKFGVTVLNLIESVTKLSQISIRKSWLPFSKVRKEELEEFDHQIENLRKMLVSVANDARVILIKFSDRIHNLQTLNYLPQIKREKIAREAIEIYAPIAERLGMGEWKGEIEDLAFPYLYPKEYKEIRERFIPKIEEREKYLESIVENIKQVLAENKIASETHFRVKKWFSLFKKLKKYEFDESKIYDLIAVRVIVSSVEDCYKALGLIHSLYKPLVGRIKDYIAFSKPNGYRSIHTTVICKKGVIVEFQIRTNKMHYQAEFGVAAHWLYDRAKESTNVPRNMIGWLTDFSKTQKGVSATELADSFRMDLFQNRIFVFTPDGDVKNLPLGATPVDFAYSVHTWLGNHCGQAKINDKIATLDTKLNNGDRVEIIASKNGRPREDWLHFVKTHLARNQIRRELKTEDRWRKIDPLNHLKKRFKK